jgi:hypothetical protein
MGRMTSHILWKIIQMFETTNQKKNAHSNNEEGDLIGKKTESTRNLSTKIRS